MIERNKSDFEKAIEELEEANYELKGILDQKYIDKIEDVLNEYNGHYKQDIEKLIEENESLIDEVDELKANAQST